MTKRNLTPGLIAVGLFALCGALSVFQIIDDRQDRRRAFARGYAAATCEWVKLVYPDPGARPPAADEVLNFCKSWDGRLKP